jgi:hypothetical protein
MDVRGPRRAAAKRLPAGMVVACAVAAAGTPAAMAATVSNLHTAADPTVPEPAAATYTDSDVSGAGSVVTLRSDGPAHNLQIADSVPLEAPVGGLDGDNTCAATDPALPNPPFLCPLATAMNVDLGAGDDTLALGDNLPPLDVNGGSGSDRLDFSAVNAPVTIDLGAAAPAAGLTLASVENVTGTASDDALTGDANDNSLDGGAGANTLRGGAGNDTLRAASASAGDVLSGGAGSDTFFGAASTEILALDQAADTITCSTDGTDAVVANLGAGGVSDVITNPNDCGSINGPVPPSPAGTGTTDTLTNVIVVPAIGNPRLTQVLAPGKANPADLTPPSASMRTFSRQRITTLLKRGVRVRVTCREACGISIALSVDRATAKRLKLDARSTPVVIGTATATRIVRGNTVLKVKLTKPAKAALKATKRSVRANTQVLVSDASGNGTLLSRHVMLVR